MKYPELILQRNQIDSYIASEKGDIANHYTPLQNMDSTTGRGNFTSTGLQFDVQKPIQMDIIPEYDGSVNIIMNDDKHLPKLINSGFSVEENNTYKIPEHNGNAVTNVYDEKTLEGDTSLFKLYKSIPNLTFNGIQDGGSFPCGSFVFYFRLADADGNVTNIVQESGVVQVHIGQVNTSHVRMGQENENSYKQISFTLTDLDKSFDYVKVLYEKTSGNGTDTAVITTYTMIDRNYPIKDGKCDILITGAEGTFSDLTLQDIQTQYADIQTAKTQAIEQNMLFLGNVSSYEVQYKKLQQLVWRIIPREITSDEIGHITSSYDFQNGSGYYDVKNVYNYTGYWQDEIYKFGVCFIYGNNVVSKVFPLQGVDFNKIPYKNTGRQYDYVFDKSTDKEETNLNREYWETDTDDHFFKKAYLTNSQGVIRFSKGSTIDTRASYNIKAKGIQFTLNQDIVEQLTKLNIVGLFFVRQKRVPTILGQGVVIGLTSKDTGSLPVIQNNGQYCAKSFLDENRMLAKYGGDITNIPYVTTQALLLPDAELQTPIYNDLLNSDEHCLERVGHFEKSIVDLNDAGQFKDFTEEVGNQQLVKLTSVPQDSKILTNGTDYFSTLAGYPEEAWRCVDIKQIWEETAPQYLTTSTSLVRGQFGYYVGMSANSFTYGDVVNIKNKKFMEDSAYEQAFMERFSDKNPYFSISRRMNLPSSYKQIDCYGGDCFTSVYTHKMCSNFADTELPTNTKILDPKCWAKNFIVRTTAYCELTKHSNVSKSNDGFYLDGISPSTKKGVPTYNHEIVEEVTLDVASYPKELNITDTEREYAGKSITEFADAKTDTDTSDSSYITYQEDVIIGQTTKPDDYKVESTKQGGAWAQAFLLPGAFPLTTFIQLAKAQKLYAKGLDLKDAFGLLSKNQKEPVQTGVKLIDALIKVKYYKNHNFVTRGLTNINRSDVNAVSFGQWITFPICSSINLAFRDVDMSRPTEEASHNHKRTFYPYEGQNKELHLPESQTVNGGAKKSISTNGLALYPSVPYIKQEFFNRIYWSKPTTTQTIANGYRLVYSEQYKEYNKEYGAITKIIPQRGTLLVVFQHGIGQLQIDATPKSELETSQYVASKAVLNTNLSIISDMYGSMWQDSVIITSLHEIFGVDTVARKIWSFSDQLNPISDHKVEKFLNDFIDLSEFDFNEYLAHVNVKTHYNAFKYDVIFTFYRDKVTSWEMTDDLINEIREWILQDRIEVASGETPGDVNLVCDITFSDIDNNTNSFTVTYKVSNYEDEEYKWVQYQEIFTLRKGHAYSSTGHIIEATAKPLTWDKGTTWALCYNSVLKEFTTFYDWYPLLSENIDNIYFSFDKDAYDDTLNGTVSGIKKIILSEDATNTYEISTEDKSLIDNNFSGQVQVIENLTDKNNEISITLTPGDANNDGSEILCYYLWNTTTNTWDFKKQYVTYKGEIGGIQSTVLLTIPPYGTVADIHTVSRKYLLEHGAISSDYTKFIDSSYAIKDYYLKNSSTIPSMAIWKHGQAGLFDNQGKILPTNWYGKQHEFNFEFIAKDERQAHKIFSNLYILSNKAEPSKFEYEVVGESYDWWDYKPIIEWINNQEIPAGLTVEYWYDQVIGHTAAEMQQQYPDFPDFYPEEHYEDISTKAVNNSRIISKLPKFAMKLTDKKGTPEIPVYPYDGITPKDNWENLKTHPYNKYAFNCNEECLVKDEQLNEIRVRSESLGNNVKKYGRTRGNMQYKEDHWNVEIRPIKVTWYYKQDGELKTYTTETRHRDKYIRIRVRYSGKDLALISAVITLYEDSFA